jgi:hypothetical protein
MMNRIKVGGYELVQVRKSDQEKSPSDAYDKRIMQHVVDAGVCTDPRFDENGDMVSDQGAVYALPKGGFVTQYELDKKYPEARTR